MPFKTRWGKSGLVLYYPDKTSLIYYSVKQTIVHAILLMSLTLSACTSRSVNAQTPQAPAFAVTLKNSTDQLSIDFQENISYIDISSPGGIGSARLTLESGDLPEGMVVRLHLAGLEELRLSSERNTLVLVASIPSHAGLSALSQRKISGNNEQALRSFDALWLAIRIVAETQKIPLQSGWFEITVPARFLQEASGTFELQWVDFFR